MQQVAGVWRGSDWHERGGSKAWPTGYGALDAELPGGGWPANALIEVLQPAQTHAEWPLLLPGLAARMRQGNAQAAGGDSRRLVLVAPPFQPFVPGLLAAGIGPERLCCVHRPAGAKASWAVDMAWACEQALHCRDVLAVLAWLPDLPLPVLRRLQLAAASHGRPLWLWGALEAGRRSSPAALRLQLEPGDARAVGMLQVRLLKRKGPALDKVLLLPRAARAWAPIMQAQAARQTAQAREARLLMQGHAVAGPPGTTAAAALPAGA
jgi:protein ImuA